jgi:hypothetical protein
MQEFIMTTRNNPSALSAPVPAVVSDPRPKSLSLAAGAMPEWMKNERVEGTDTLGKYQSTPRIGIVQGSSKPDRKAEHGEGGVAIFPDGVHVADSGEEFVIIPLVFWVTWEKWSDINDQSQQMVLETTQDETSEIAVRAKDRNRRNETYRVGNNDYKYKYVESLNFICLLDSGPAKGEVVSISFHIGEHRVGLTLSGNIKRRKNSIYGNRFSLKTSIRNRNNRSWYGFEINNPAGEPGGFVRDQDQYKSLQQMHRDLDSLVKSAKIAVGRDEDDAGDNGGGADGDGSLPV